MVWLAGKRLAEKRLLRCLLRWQENVCSHIAYSTYARMYTILPT